MCQMDTNLRDSELLSEINSEDGNVAQPGSEQGIRGTYRIFESSVKVDTVPTHPQPSHIRMTD